MKSCYLRNIQSQPKQFNNIAARVSYYVPVSLSQSMFFFSSSWLHCIVQFVVYLLIYFPLLHPSCFVYVNLVCCYTTVFLFLWCFLSALTSSFLFSFSFVKLSSSYPVFVFFSLFYLEDFRCFFVLFYVLFFSFFLLFLEMVKTTIQSTIEISVGMSLSIQWFSASFSLMKNMKLKFNLRILSKFFF